MKLEDFRSRAFKLREAAAIIFALVGILPLLLFVFYLWRSELIREIEGQIGLFLALLIAILGFVVFRRLVDRISTLAQALAAGHAAPLTDTEVPTLPGLGQVTEVSQLAAAFGRLIEDLRASTERLEDFVFKLGTLSEMAELAARIPKSQELLALVLERTMRTVRAATGSIMFLDPQRKRLQVVAARGLGQEAIIGAEVGVGEGIAGTAAHLGKALLIEDVERDPRFEKVHDVKFGSGSVISVPFRVGERLIGVLNLASNEPGSVNLHAVRPFSSTDLQFLTALTTHIAYAVDNARLLEQARQAAQRLQEVVDDQQLRLTLAQQQMVQAEKLSAMSQVVAGIAHELNNPLSIVTGRTALLRQTVGSGPLAAQAEKIAKAAERCVRIVRNFLTLAREHPPERRRTSLNQLVREALEFLAYNLRVDNVEVTLDLAPDLPVLWADPHQLQQVVVNIVSNAHQAMRATPTPRRLNLTTRFNPLEGRASLEVADTGPGIPPEIQKRIFEPFFTTKPPGQGTGLGLSLCHGIVVSHGGIIRVESQPGQGAVFVVELPVETLPAAVPKPQEAAVLPSVQGKTILVVDDEPDVAEVLADILSAHGHQVETAPNGLLALEKLREGTYDLILSDVRMPTLDGPGLYREVEDRYPGLHRRIIFLTGDVLSSDIKEFLEQTKAPGLSKPFDPAEVYRVTQELLRLGQGQVGYESSGPS